MNRNNCFFLRKVEDTYFLQSIDSSKQKMVFLNETGAFLWEKLSDCETKENLVKELIATYDVQQSIAEKDVAGFLAFLSDNGCLMQEGVSDR